MAELSFRLILQTDDATGKLSGIKQEADGLKSALEKPHQVKIDAAQSLASIRDVTIAVQGVMQAMSSLTRGINGFLDAELGQRRAMILATQAFGEGATEMARFASEMQNVTNFEDDQLLALMAKMGAAFKLSTEDVRALTPSLLDFTEAFSATGMTAESAFDLMGRALNGHTEMLGRYGIELDKTRLEMEGVSYLVETLGKDYGGTAAALADLRTQNRNAWGDIKETVGGMLAEIFNPLLKGVKALMDGFNSLSPVMKGVVAGLALAIPVIVTLATTITAVTAAVTALKIAINPVVGIISLVTGAVVAGAVAYGSYASAADAAAASAQELAEADKAVSANTQKQLNNFDALVGRLRTLKTAANATAESKKQLKEVSDEMVRNYGALLGKIDLERASWREVEKAIYDARAQLVSYYVAQETKGRFDALMGQYTKGLKDLQILAKSVGVELDIYSNRSKAWPKLTEPQFTGKQYLGIAAGGLGNLLLNKDNKEQDRIRQIVIQYNTLVDQVNELQARINKDLPEAQKAMDMLFNFGEVGLGGPAEDGYNSTGGSAATATAATVDAELAEFERMIKSLQAASQDAFQRHDAEYARRLELINKYTERESNERKQALIMLHEWDTAETQKIFEDERAAMQKAFEEKIAYYANLNELGVNSYDQLKAATEEYYEWAKDNLPEKERELVLAQLRQTNLRWGQQKQEQIEQEEAHQRELADIRDEFAGRGLELDNNTYALQIRALDNYYKKRKQKLIEAGLTEEEITAQHQKAILKLNLDAAGQVLGGVSSILGDLASAMDQENATQFKIWKGLAIAQAIVDTLASANAAYKAMATIPVAGPGLAVAAAAAALAAGYLNVKKISATEYKPTAATGGYLIGAPHAAGGTVIEAEGGEYIIRKDRVSSLGKSFFDFVNSASLTTVRAAFAGFSLPSLPMPAYAGSFAASGGYVTGPNSNSALLDELRALKEAILGSRPIVNVRVDPLSNDPVKISEIAERGTRIRSII